MKLSEYCKKLRKETGLSMQTFAKIRNVTHTYVLDTEIGKRNNPSAKTLVRIMEVYQLTTDDLTEIEFDFQKDSQA